MTPRLATPITVTLTTELWLVGTDDGGWTLGPPIAINAATGRGMPGVVKPPPTVLVPGRRIKVVIEADDAPTQAT